MIRADLAAALVALNPDAIFGDNTFVIAELKQATRTLPIIFARVTDPILSGIVSSLPRPDAILQASRTGNHQVRTLPIRLVANPMPR